jgi:hypothetical protein
MRHPTRVVIVGLMLVAGCTPTGPTTPADVTPAASPTATPPDESSGTAVPSATPGAPSAAPSASLDPTALDLEVTSCNGGVVLEWTPSRLPDFHHYIALRSPVAEIATQYPPIAPAVDWGDTYATDPFITSAVDASIIPSTTRWHYRVMAYDAAGRVIGSSPVRSARLLDVDDMGDLSLTTAGAGTSVLRWEPFGGFSGCFSSYRILAGAGSPSSVVSVVSNLATTELRTDAFHPGITYAIRVQAVRVTTLGSFVAGETTTLTYTVPSGE